MNYEVIIGLELHSELKTKTKMFSMAPTAFDAPVNSCVESLDMGFLGALPLVNKYAVELAVRACFGLEMDIDQTLVFDRKNYFYSDLPKGYQLTQQFHPIGSNGKIVLANDKVININRLHIEEDTAKQFHYTDETLIDYNRSGNPLIEIVSDPDINSSDEAVEFVEQVASVLKYLDVSNVRMEEGSLRCDVNISLRPFGYTEFGSKVEIKNLNSLNNIKRAIDFEIKRQQTILNSGDKVLEETRRFDETTASTVLMRLKDDSVDYRYFRDANILPYHLSDDYLAGVKNNLPELASERYARYLALGLSEYDSQVLVNNKDLSDFYDEVIEYTDDYKVVANWALGDLSAYLNKHNLAVSDLELVPKELANLINSVNDKLISGKQAKRVFDEIVLGKATKAVIEELDLGVIADEKSIIAFIDEAIKANPQSVEDYKAGRDRALGFLMGQVMRLSKGKVDPQKTNRLIKQQLDNML